ncbi:MAG: phosphopyruvate hydratase [bacterium]
MKIANIHAHEILDSRGNPTVSVTVVLDNGARGIASVPSGASTGVHEALELRDGDVKRYRGQGVKKAVANVNNKILPALLGHDALDQKAIDAAMIKLDGTKNKSKLGANAILGVSLAVARAASRGKEMPLFKYLREAYGLSYSSYKMPMPMVNILNGGRHADTDLDFQEFMVVPVGAKKMAERVRIAAEVFHALGAILKARKLSTGVGNEGGYAPMVGKTIHALDMLVAAIKKAGFKPGKDIAIAVDAAASEFYDEKSARYILRTDKVKYKSSQMTEMFANWAKKYPLISVEDGLAEDDWTNWVEMTKANGEKMMLVGDDLFVTKAERLQKGISLGVGNAILIKLNQIGTLSETMETILLAKQYNYKVVISHRSGETTDTTIADLAVAVNAEFIKTGSMSRGERVAKYNRLMEIAEEVGG